MTAATVGQAGVEFLYRVDPSAFIGQAGSEYIHRVDPGITISQVGLEYLHRVQPAFAISQTGAEYLHKAVPCTTRWAQIWTIERTDGEVFRFTSLNRDLIWNGQSYQACDSLVPSASENANEVGTVGNMELGGVVAALSVSPIDLEAGRFDGAYVEAWLVPWDGVETPKALLRGTFGKVEHGENGFSVEMVGDGGRLLQTPLIHTLQPGCRWIFGSAECGKDLGPLTVTGTVDLGEGQRGFTDAARAEAPGHFDYGRVTFTTGLNTGLSAEIKDHLVGGVFTLWPRLPSPIAAGDQYSMTPGCTNLKESVGGTNGCIAWANVVNYGGFDHMPGGDALGETPVAKD